MNNWESHKSCAAFYVDPFSVFINLLQINHM